MAQDDAASDGHENDLTTSEVELAAIARELDAKGAFDPTDQNGATVHVLASIVRRRGQPKFRETLLKLYGQRCAISRCPVVAILEAAHIRPYNGEQTNHLANGLILRADLHTLFDLKLIAIDEAEMTVLVSDDLLGTEYECFDGTMLSLPSDSRFSPSTEALRIHRLESKLKRGQ